MMRLVLAKPRLTYHIAVVYPILFHKGDGHAIQQNINQKICLALLVFFSYLFLFIICITKLELIFMWGKSVAL